MLPPSKSSVEFAGREGVGIEERESRTLRLPGEGDVHVSVGVGREYNFFDGGEGMASTWRGVFG
jgi:hypothetical protein